MKTRFARTTLFTHTVALALAAVLLWGCQPNEKTRQTASAEPEFSVRIDRSQNGAAAAPSQRPADQKTGTTPRTLAFEMTGAGQMSEPGTSQEQRIAANQAAIIEAFCKAVTEARKAKGQPGDTFSVDFGPRLKVTRTAIEDGYESRVSLVSRGIETVFIVRNGKLQHEPHDLHQVQQIFDATNGEFALLGTSVSPAKGECVATVAHYVPGEVNSALAGSVPNDKNDSATDPDSAQ